MSIIAVAVSGCSFVDEVHVNLGDGVRLISINDPEQVIEREDKAAEGMVSGAAISEANSGASPGPRAQATGFKCSLEQSGTRSSLLSSLFSPPEKTSLASLTCWRLFELPQNGSSQTN
ncbi:hypothetical protein [Minwuia thermotolerans]|uniref:hypothetical protein n=1 Tax=Minwuia thermotolerans TaxID=2056226 RepID=UPI000F637FAE|nr:hypothetical protein [Minwuia thermotolerans]